MRQIVTLNGRPHDLDHEPSLKVGTQQDRTPVEINGGMVHGVNINGYDYPPCEPGCVLHMPGLPGYGSTIWDRSGQGNHGTITGATWVRLPSGLWGLSFDGSDDKVEGSISLSPPYTLIFWAWENGGDAGFFDGSNYVDGLFFSFGAGRDLYFNNNSQIGPLTNTAINTYQMYTAVVNGASSSIRLNNGTPVTGTLAARAMTGYILGMSGNENEYKLKGEIYLLRIVSRALTTPQINNVFQEERHLLGV